MSSKKTKFNIQWLDSSLYPQFSPWLSNVKDSEHKAYCTVCCKTFELSNMGKQAVVSHSKGPNHCKFLKIKSSQKPLTMFVSKPGTSVSTDLLVNQTSSPNNAASTSNLPAVKATSQKQIHISSFMCKDDVVKAEIIWAMEVVQKKHSLNSCSSIAETFKLMFPDSAIAAQFKMGSTKASYVINYGLAKYFNDSLVQKLQGCDNFTVCFDEALNKVAQKCQMDIVLKFWQNDTGMVSTRYLGSCFLGCASAKNLLEKFTEGLKQLPPEKIIHISMDGPNVNISFLNKFEEDMNVIDPDGKKLIKFGTCGLHTVHGSVKFGIKSVHWTVLSFLRNLYFLFKDSPARRSQFTTITGCVLFPKKCCAIRWLENVDCLERALEIIDDVKKFLTEGKVQGSKVCDNLREALRDPFLKCQLAFFKSLCAQCEPFLRRFQSPKPLIPFLYEELSDLLDGIMKRFIKAEKLSITPSQIFSLDLESNENLIEAAKVDIGFGARKYMKVIKCSECDKLSFKLECRKILKSTTKKLLERSPLKYRFVRCLSSLNPSNMIRQRDLCQDRFNKVLETLHDARRIEESVAEKAKQQYGILSSYAVTIFKKQFKDFVTRKNDEIGLDSFYFSLLNKEEKFTDLWNIIKICLILSHGNASVESGFSVNRSLLVENLTEESLVSQRQVHDGIISAGGTRNVTINKDMLLCVRSSYRRYADDLEKKKKMNREKEQNTQDKRQLQMELNELAEKKKRLRLEKEKEEFEIEKKINFLNDKKKALQM